MWRKKPWSQDAELSIQGAISIAGSPRTFKLNGDDSIFLNTVTTHQSIFFHSLTSEKGVSNKKRIAVHICIIILTRVFHSFLMFVRFLIRLSVGPFFTHC